MKHSFTVVDRFLRYVEIDTQSDPHSNTIPSTEKQKNLGRLLVKELLEMGVKDAELDEFGYIYATIPSNSDKKVPSICLCSHMDTSPESSGKDVKPIIRTNYDGGKIFYDKDSSLVLDPAFHPALLAQKGNDIITSDGTTLLGADNKAGLAEIMDMAYYFMQNPEIKHGDIKILFTPDEEIGRGADKVDLKKLKADFAYTVDGESLGDIEDETFSADKMELEFHGINSHPGFAKNSMVNAIKVSSSFLDSLPKDKLSPETTDRRDGFFHPYEITGGVEAIKITFIIRSFIDSELKEFENLLEEFAKKAVDKFEGSRFSVEVTEQYRNMKNILDQNPQIVDFAVKAIEKAGLKPNRGSIRGGTDGSRLSFMGLPCPNIFAGEHAFHSKIEWISVYDMRKAVETLVNLLCIWHDESTDI